MGWLPLEDHLFNNLQKLTRLSSKPNASSGKTFNIGTLLVKFNQTISKIDKIFTGIGCDTIHETTVLIKIYCHSKFFLTCMYYTFRLANFLDKFSFTFSISSCPESDKFC